MLELNKSKTRYELLHGSHLQDDDSITQKVKRQNDLVGLNVDQDTFRTN